jgi:hypothetical protein
MENVKRGKERLNVAKLTRGDNAEPKITGGYIFKRDKSNSPNDRLFYSTKKLQFIWEEPKGRDVTPKQEQYVTNYINEFELVLYSDTFDDPANGYRKYIDVDSFVDYHWMQELGKGPDAYWTSEFFHKDRGGKLKMGPIWDFDLCYGNAHHNKGYLTNEWRWQKSGGPNYKWFRRLFEDPDFLQRYIDRWSELRASVLSTSNVLALIDRYADELKDAQKRNYERWPTLGNNVGPNWFVGQTYEEEVNYLKDWMRGRLEWIDTQDFPKPAIAADEPQRRGDTEGISTEGSKGSEGESGKEGEKGGKGEREALASSKFQATSFKEAPNPNGQTGRSIRMACLVGKIFYTKDGSDPRLAGGAVSDKAAQYTEAILVTAGLKLVARVRSDYGLWSAPVVYGEPQQKLTKETK